VRTFALFILLASCAHTTPPFVDGPQGRLHVDDGGRGAAVPILFVHGNGGNLTQWTAPLEHVRRTRRAVAFDLRGMGMSDPPRNGDYSVAAMTDDVEAVANALRLNRFVIVGHSYGGTVVAAYAAKHPERVAAVVLADAAGEVHITPDQASAFLARMKEDKDKFVRAWFEPILKPSSERVRNAVLESEYHTSYDAIAGALGGLLNVDMKAFVAAYHGPRLAIGASDIESASSFHMQFPEVPTKKMTGVGHWLMMDKPDEFNAILDQFLATLPR
jgi:pimeloyl-ACP methyl ester carboxylesterase